MQQLPSIKRSPGKSYPFMEYKLSIFIYQNLFTENHLLQFFFFKYTLFLFFKCLLNLNVLQIQERGSSYVQGCAFHNAFSPAIGVFGTDGLDIDDNVIHFTVGEGNMIIFWSNNLSFSDSLACKLWSHGVQLVFLQKWKWAKFVLTWELLNCMWPLNT